MDQNYHTLADHTVDHYDPYKYSEGETNKYHCKGHHAYLIAGTLLNADVVISVPKVKTHRKAGVSLSLKNTIGIVPDKVYMPHHRPGTPPEGDSFPEWPDKPYIKKRKKRLKTSRKIASVFGQKISNSLKSGVFRKLYDKVIPFPKDHSIVEWGDWYGNDTLWRTILDLNRILIYADRKGKMCSEPQRKYFSILDGIISQEGEGPMTGDPIKTGFLVAGSNPVAVDTICTLIMGFDPKKIKTIEKAYDVKHFPLCEFKKEDIKINCNVKILPTFNFKTNRGWKNHLEAEENLT